jgi:hypothetical protein
MDIRTIDRCIEILQEELDEACDEIKAETRQNNLAQKTDRHDYNIYKAVQVVADKQELIDLLIEEKEKRESVNA